MADIHDFLNAQRATENQIRDTVNVAEGLNMPDPNVQLAVVYGLLAVARAVQELGHRLDYVIRDEARR